MEHAPEIISLVHDDNRRAFAVLVKRPTAYPGGDGILDGLVERHLDQDYAVEALSVTPGRHDRPSRPAGASHDGRAPRGSGSPAEASRFHEWQCSGLTTATTVPRLVLGLHGGRPGERPRQLPEQAFGAITGISSDDGSNDLSLAQSRQFATVQYL